MTAIREDIVWTVYNRTYTLMDMTIYDTLDKQHEFKKQTILADESLTKDEKLEVIKFLNVDYDNYKILSNEGIKRICENCQVQCLATLYCEHCVRNYLKANFSNWSSGNDDIDDLIQKCQLETFRPDKIVEWIPYNNLQDIKYLTKGGCSEIYTATWIGGGYLKWNSKEKQLERFGDQYVILKELKNVESANRSWFEEGKSHLTISNKWADIVSCYGLTKNLSNRNYMLVINKMDMDLRIYLQQNYNKLTWKEKIKIAYDIIHALFRTHYFENEIHRDLHSGNILYLQLDQEWYISDLGFCGPPDKPLNSVYGNLSYIAPEVITGKETTFASDIYSIGILMWEISSGQPPFINHKHNYDLAMKIVNGMRPKIVPGTPLEYKKFMKQCWNADPTKRPDAYTLLTEIKKLLQTLYFQNENDELISSNQESSTLYKSNSIDSINENFTSKIYQFYQFENFLEPKNATEEEQEAFHSKPYSFNIPDNIDDFNNSSNKNASKSSKVYKDIKNDHYESVQLKKHDHMDIDDDDDVYNNSNFHSEEQNDLEITNGKQ
ncbi:kinase-like domain-containing protein [Glomus cerebriforme]|uniref:Kinase-like domain-containing protein n=1 Tax=Glomus cerebriforme TaxID=658196 RepID=A0A397S7X9_9GLOM|nr:kinase-like domain-containing protein [Glomus cerebriforme]